MSPPAGTFRFGDFVLDLSAYELRRLGRPVRLERQPMDLLILLVERRRQLVSRGEIIDRLWGKDVFVDVETGVNTAISKVRQALRDSTDAPAFVETVPGKGYRFIAPVDVVSEAALPTPAAIPLPAPEAARPSPPVPSNRYRRAIALLAGVAVVGLLAWTRLGGGSSVARVSLAVLPFENLGSDPERDYLASGLTDETSASLAQIDPERLSVKGRTLSYKGSTKSVAEIGQELSVDYLVESSIRAEGGRLRITAKLIRVRDQEYVWSQSYEREPTSLLGLQQELSTAIAEQVRMRLSPDRATGLRRRQTQNAAAYDAYLRGRYIESRRTPVSNARAIEEYKRAIAIDPDYALAWSSLGFIYAGSPINGDARPLAVGPLARDAAAHALRANPNLSESQSLVGYVNWMLDWNWPAAQKAFRLAIQLDPSNAREHRLLGHSLSQSGLQEEAEASMQRARELGPLEPVEFALSAVVAYQGRHYPAALELARQAIFMDSTFWIGHMALGQVFAQTGKTELALESLRDAARFSGNNSKAISLAAYLLAKTGRTAEAREMVKKLEADSLEKYVPPYAIAFVYAGLGDRDAVFAWLDKAYAERDVHLMYLPVDAIWDPYRKDARFVEILARCGFAWRG